MTPSTLPPSLWAQYRSSLLSILRSTSSLLDSGASALDAATHAVAIFEEDPLFNCGKGAVFTRDGTIELEASVMVSRGWRKRGAAVSLLTKVKSPIGLAKEVLVRGGREGEEDEDEDEDEKEVRYDGTQWENSAEYHYNKTTSAQGHVHIS